MDDLAAQLATSFAVSNEPNTTAAAHPRFSQYKSKSTAMDQNSRRMRILEKQKQQRFDYVNHIRSLSEDTWSNADAESVNSMDSLDTEMETESEIKLRKPGRYYKNQLMLSEWLVDVPADFTEEWCTVPCPVGKRCLVVASRGHTSVYTRSGYRLNTFTSTLPGGNKKHRRENAILDCIYDEVNGIYYIIDIMCWKNHPVYDSDTEFRFYWLRTRIDEYQNVTEKTKNNPYRFIPIPNFAATQEGILNAIDAAQFEMDGLLFYHKKTHYTFGSTPLVVWLKPFMIPEILGFNVPEKAMAQKPSDYVNYQQHMINFEQERERIRAERQAKGAAARAAKKEKMEHESSIQEDQEGEKEESTTNNVSGNSRGGESRSRKYEEKAQRMTRRQYGDGYRMDLMFSEWMTELPEDFESEWLMVVCPMAKRHIVVAQEGETLMQNKNGNIVDGFRSLLPGGNPNHHKDRTILDTLFNKKTNTFYVLDALYWKDQDLTSCETDLRFFWFTTRMAEISGLDKESKLNAHKFIPLANFPCTKEGLQTGLDSVDYEVDGLLFFRKKFGYVAGPTDTVLWLKPYMLPELVDVKVPEELMKKQPANYTTFSEHSEKVKKNMEERKEKEAKRKHHRRERQPVIDIDQLVDDISQLYINKKLGVEVARNQNQQQPKSTKGKGKGGNKKQGPGGRQRNFGYQEQGYDDWNYYNQRGYYDGWDDGSYYNRQEDYGYGNQNMYGHGPGLNMQQEPAYGDYLEDMYSSGYRKMGLINRPYSADDMGYSGMRGVSHADRYQEYLEPELYREVYNAGLPMAAGRGGLLSSMAGGMSARTPAGRGGFGAPGWDNVHPASGGRGAGGKPSAISSYKRTHKMFKH